MRYCLRMETETLTSQSEVNQAIASGATRINIDSPAYPRIEVNAPAGTVAVLWGNSRAVLRGNSRAEATPGAVLFKHDKRATAKGGVLVDNTKRDLTDPAQWCEFHGIKVSRAGIATVYKAVDDQWTTDSGTSYAPGSKPSAPDWRDDNECGGGLHFSPSPKHAKDYHPEATRFVAVGVRVSELRPLLGGTAKCKAPAVVRACVAVDDRGNKL